MSPIFNVYIFLFSAYLYLTAGSQKKIIFLIAEREYKTEETLPKFAEKYLSSDFSIEFCNAPNAGPKRNQLSNP